MDTQKKPRARRWLTPGITSHAGHHTNRQYYATLLLFIITLYCVPILSASEAPLAQGKQDNTIRIVMSAAFVSESGVDIYKEIAHYLEEKLNYRVEFISGFSYATINSMLESGLADIGFICGLPYILEREGAQPKIELLLAPVMKNAQYKDSPIYYSYIITHKDSKMNSFSDLKGSTFVYNDEISNSGYNMPRAHLINMGETSRFFGKIKRSGSHEESIRMVALGAADVSAVDSLVYDYDLINNPDYVSQTKIIKVLGPAGIPPVVISTKTPAALRLKISEALLGMNKDPAGKIILEKALLDRFTTVNDSNYDSIRKMNQMARDSGYQVIR